MHTLQVVFRDIRLGIKNLLLHKLRSLLTMLGLVFGVGSVIAMLAVGEGASKEALDQIRKLGSNNIILTSVKPSQDEAPSQVRTFMSVYGLSYDDACFLYGNVAEILSNSIYCSDDDPGEWNRGGYVTINFESGLPWSYYDDGLDVLCDLDDKVNALLAASGVPIRVFNELQNAAVTCVYDS